MRLAAWVWPAGLLPAGGLLVALAWVTSNLAGRESAPIGGPTVQITAPASGFKLRQGRTMAVRVSVHAGQQPLQGWTLRLISSQSDATELAEGTEAVDDRAVAQVAAESLPPPARPTRSRSTLSMRLGRPLLRTSAFSFPTRNTR
jgi:hypothetical protein